MKKTVYVTLGVLAVSLALAIGAGPVKAKDVAPSYTEDPGVYQLLSENENFRVIMATWKPGQRDKWHSHAGAATSYRLTDCNMRAHTPDGKSTAREGKRGSVAFNPIIPSHSLENIGTTDCQLLIVEKK
jgi:mannose-6-phosphate isomerase-like protein (cupin superfamily)